MSSDETISDSDTSYHEEDDESDSDSDSSFYSDLYESEDNEPVNLGGGWQRISDCFADVRPTAEPPLLQTYSGVNPVWHGRDTQEAGPSSSN